MSQKIIKAEKTKAAKAAPKLNIYQRLLLVQAECNYIRKEYKKGVNHYAVSHDEVTEYVRGSLITHGVYFHVDTLERQDELVERKTRTVNYTRLKILVAFVNVDNPEDKVLSQFWGDGEGADCKTPGAAYSFAVKTALLKSLLIVTGEDEEVNHLPEKDAVDAAVEVKASATPDDRDKFYGALKDLCASRAWSYDEALEYCHIKIGGPIEDSSVDELRRVYATADKTFEPRVVVEQTDHQENEGLY